MGIFHLFYVLFFATVAFCAAVDPSISYVYGAGISKVTAGVPGTVYITLAYSNGTNVTTCNYKNNFFVVIMQGSKVIQAPGVGCSADYPAGQYNVVFYLNTVGSYQLYLNYSGQAVSKSPYTFTVAPGPPYGPACKTSGTGLTGGVVGNDLFFQIVTYDQYGNLVPNCYALSFWKVTLSGASSIKGSVFFCQEGSGLYNASYDATVSGFYVLNVQFNGSNVVNQPVFLSPGPLYPHNCYLSVEGSAVVGSPVTVDIIEQDAEHNLIETCNATQWSGTISRNGKNQQKLSISCNSDNVPIFTFNVNVSGLWDAFVYYQGQIIGNGSSSIAVAPGPIVAANTRAEGVGMIEGIAGVPTDIYIIPYDQYDNRIKTCESLSNFKITPLSINCTANMFTCDKGNYTALYICTVAIQVEFTISYKGSKIADSPVYPQIIPGPPSAPQCYARGSGISQAQAGSPALFTILAYDQYDNKISTCLPKDLWDDAWQISVHDSQVVYQGVVTNCSDGEYSAQYTIIQLSQLYILDIFYYSSPIENSGIQLVTYAGPPYPPKCNATGPGLSGSEAGVATWASVSCSDQYNNPISSCKFISSNWTVFLKGLETFDGYYVNCTPGGKFAAVIVGYNVTVAGEYDFIIDYTDYVVYDGMVTIVPGPYDPSNTIAYGPGVGDNGNLIAGYQTMFYLAGRDRWNNTIMMCPATSDWTISIRGRSFGTNQNFSIVGCSDVNGLTNVTYLPVIAQQYNVDIRFNGSEIVDSPYIATVVAAPPDAGSIIANGTGTVSGVAGEVTTFNLYLYDQYGNTVAYCGFENNFDVTLTGTQRNFVGGVQCQNGIYTGYYNVTVAGTYTMDIDYNGKAIRDSPFHPQIVANVIYAPHCYVTGNMTQFAGVYGALSISCSDYWNNAISVCTSSAFGVSSNNKRFYFQNNFTTCSNGVYSTNYNGTQATTVQVVITWKGVQIANSPIYIVIKPNAIVAMNSVASGTGLMNNQVGVDGDIAVTGIDWWGNVNTTCFTGSDIHWAFTWLAAPKGGNVSVNQEPVGFCNAGVYNYYYYTTVIGTYKLQITWEGSPISQSPWTFVYVAGPPDPAHCLANGTGTQNIVAGNRAIFYIYTYDSFGNPVSNCSNNDWQIMFEDPTYVDSQTKISCNSANGVFTVTYYGYEASYPSTWTLKVEYSGVQISNSPFEVTEVANVIYAPTSDVGLQSKTVVSAGQMYSFNIVTYDFWNNLNVSCNVSMTAFGVSIQSSSGKNVFTGIVDGCKTQKYYTAEFNITVTGTYYLSVFYEKVLVSNQTYLIECGAGPVWDQNAVVSGPLLTNQNIAGYSSVVKITQYDQYDNINTTCLNNYWMVQASANGNVYFKHSVSSSYCSNGVYSYPVTLTAAQWYNLTVSGAYSQTSGSPYPFVFINSDVDGSYTAIYPDTIPSQVVIGSMVTVLLDLRDEYNNPVMNCNFTNNLWSMSTNFTDYTLKFSTSCTSGSNNMSLSYQFNHSYSSNNNWIKVYVYYDSDEVINSPMKYELTPGHASAYSYAAGDGVSDLTSNIAGQWIFFEIFAVNEYGVEIPVCPGFDISFSPEVVYESDFCHNGVTAVQYNATLATAYSISITLNGSSIMWSPYTGVVYPDVIDLAMTQYSGELFEQNPANDSGTFELRVRDRWGNPETTMGPDLFTGVLTPSCSNTSVDCVPEPDGWYNCTYSVQNGGVYCFTVSYNNTILPGFVPVFVDIIGGLGCNNSCNYNGYCIQGNCSCTTKYAGSTCQYKISSHYMTTALAVGLIVGLSIACLIIGLLIGCLVARMTSKSGDRLLQ